MPRKTARINLTSSPRLKSIVKQLADELGTDMNREFWLALADRHPELRNDILREI